MKLSWWQDMMLQVAVSFLATLPHQYKLDPKVEEAINLVGTFLSDLIAGKLVIEKK
jgi:hypothetical protein